MVKLVTFSNIASHALMHKYCMDKELFSWSKFIDLRTVPTNTEVFLRGL